MKDLTLYPTGTCFNDALEFIEAMIKRDLTLVQSNHFTLCHGICQNRPNNPPFAHAWIETDNYTVIHAGLIDGNKVYAEIPLDLFYKDIGVIERTRYTVYEVRDLNYKHLNYGPWEEKYLKLCKDYQKIENGEKVHSVNETPPTTQLNGN